MLLSRDIHRTYHIKIKEWYSQAQAMVELVRRLGWSYVSTVAAEVNNPESLVHYQQHYNIIVFIMVIMYKGLSIYYVIRNGGGRFSWFITILQVVWKQFSVQENVVHDLKRIQNKILMGNLYCIQCTQSAPLFCVWKICFSFQTIGWGSVIYVIFKSNVSFV